VGHTVLSLEKLAPHIRACGLEAELALHLRHLLLSHHGLPEYGAAREPLTAEAFALHHADNLDAKLAQLRALFEELEPGASVWSPYQASLKRAVFRAPRTPGAAEARTEHARNRGDGKAPQDEQCSLL